MNETFSTFVRNFLPRYAQPEADAIENLSMAIVVDQKHLGGGSHSTVGTITDIYSVLRLLYSRVGQPYVGPPPRLTNPASGCIRPVIVIEHNLAIIKNADWIIDMGPEGGNKGGRIMFEGTPQQVLECEHSLTSAYLRQ